MTVENFHWMLAAGQLHRSVGCVGCWLNSQICWFGCVDCWLASWICWMCWLLANFTDLLDVFAVGWLLANFMYLLVVFAVG